MIERIIERACQVQDIDAVVLCTSDNPQDKPLVDIAQQNNIYYFNGSEQDVLLRLQKAASFYNLDYFLSITADNPLFSIYHANLIVDVLKREKRDFVKVAGLPLGTAPYGLKTLAVTTICLFKELMDTEIWGYLIDRPDLFDVQEIIAQGLYKRPDLRLTLDYEEDYQVINHVYCHIPYRRVMNLNNAIEYLTAHPAVAGLNRNCVQLDMDKKVKNSLDELFALKKDELFALKAKVYHDTLT